MGHQSSILRPVPGASLSDIVSVRQWLTSEEDVRTYVEVRSKFITHKPAALLGVIPSLVRPDFLIEIEVVAAVPAGKVKGPSNQPYPGNAVRAIAHRRPGNDHSALRLVLADFAKAMAMVIRAQMFDPDNHIVPDSQYNELFAT